MSSQGEKDEEAKLQEMIQEMKKKVTEDAFQLVHDFSNTWHKVDEELHATAKLIDAVLTAWGLRTGKIEDENAEIELPAKIVIRPKSGEVLIDAPHIYAEFKKDDTVEKIVQKLLEKLTSLTMLGGLANDIEVIYGRLKNIGQRAQEITTKLADLDALETCPNQAMCKYA